MKIAALPGVRAAGAASTLPPARMNWHQTILKEGRTLESPGKIPLAWRSVVIGDYFQALGITLKRGRYFTAEDRIGSTEVLIVSEALAREFWPNQDPLRKRAKFNAQDAKG